MKNKKAKDADIIFDAFIKNLDMEVDVKQVGDGMVQVSVSYIHLDVEIDAHGNIIINQYDIGDIEEVEL